MDRDIVLPGRALEGVLSELNRKSQRAQTRSRWRNQIVPFNRGAPGFEPATETAALDPGFWNVLVRVGVSASTGLSPGAPVVRLAPTLSLVHGATTVAVTQGVVDSEFGLGPQDFFGQTVWLGVSGTLPVAGELRLDPTNTTSGGTVAVWWAVSGVAFGA